jgi:NAD(P)H-nitrite reductase large subunit
MTRAVPFTQAQVRRAVKAAESAGLKVKGVKVFPDGSIAVETGESEPVTYRQTDKALAASWDDA